MGILDRDDDGTVRDDAARAGAKGRNAADEALRLRHDEPATKGDVVGEGIGGASGLAAGAALGSLGGPIGTVIGAIAGAATGWWTGRAVSEAASSFTEDEDHYRRHFASSRGATEGPSVPQLADTATMPAARRGATSADVRGDDPADLDDRDYDRARPAYQLGHLAGLNPDYRDRDFEDVEGELRAGWSDDVSARHGRWEDVRHYARDAYDHGRERRLVLSEERLAVDKRQVPAGEVELRKTVETERVRESVPLMHEEVSVERRPLRGTEAVPGATIGEDRVTVPLMAEEAVVDKRVVPTEEVVLNKRAVTEERVVEEDLRRERLVTEGVDEQTRPADRERTLGRDPDLR